MCTLWKCGEAIIAAGELEEKCDEGDEEDEE